MGGAGWPLHSQACLPSRSQRFRCVLWHESIVHRRQIFKVRTLCYHKIRRWHLRTVNNINRAKRVTRYVPTWWVLGGSWSSSEVARWYPDATHFRHRFSSSRFSSNSRPTVSQLKEKYKWKRGKAKELARQCHVYRGSVWKIKNSEGCSNNGNKRRKK